MAVLASPYPLALRYDRGTMRSYASFSWPLILASASTLVIAQSSLLVGEKVLGLAAVGAITLASSVSDYTNRVDQIVTATLYPAICAVRDRRDALFESFVKSNRLALMWGMPFGDRAGAVRVRPGAVRARVALGVRGRSCCRSSACWRRSTTWPSTGTRTSGPRGARGRSPSSPR